MKNVISVKNLSKKFMLFNTPSEMIKECLHPFRKKYHTDFQALKNISFDVKKGSCLGIVGPNGSGKSSLLQLICGILQPTEGEVKVDGRISAMIGVGAGFNAEFTGRENVFLNGAISGYSKLEMEERFPAILEFAEIGDFIDQPVKRYSSGMYAKLAFSTAINIDPDILIVDEVLSVGDERFKKKCSEKFKEFLKADKTIILVTHSMGTIKKYCDSAIFLYKGDLLKAGAPDEVIDFYMDTVKMPRPETLAAGAD